MEKKTTHRIIGILVAVALLVILMPLVFSKSDLSAQTASIQAPPFPDQAKPEELHPEEQGPTTAEITPEMAQKINGMPVAPPPAEPSPEAPAASDTPRLTPDQAKATGPQPIIDGDATAMPVMAQNTVTPANSMVAQSTETPAVQTSDAQPAAASESTQKDTLKTAAVDTSEVVKPVEAESTSAALSPATPAETPKAQASAQEDESQPAASAEPKATPKKITGKMASNSIHSKLTSKPTIASDKRTGWVIQMGSFRDKDNARRLADRLRGAGYKAFMHDVKSARGSVQTRVYIGPETKQLAAKALSSKVEQQMNLHGLVVMYKPLEL